MAFRVKILDDYDIIQLCFEGVVDAEEFLESRSQVRDMHEQHGPLNALLDMRAMEFAMSTPKIYEFASTIKHPLGVSIAMLCRPKDTDARFFETVALNNGAPIKLFTEYADALAFLTESP